jgi:hypothetical protein
MYPGAARGVQPLNLPMDETDSSGGSASLLPKIEGDAGRGTSGLVIPALCKRRLDLAVVSVMHEALEYHVLHLHTAMQGEKLC